jgi:hypothetical protein
MYAHCPLLPALECGEALRFSPHSNSPLSFTSRFAMHNYYTTANNFLHVIIIIIIIIKLFCGCSPAEIVGSNPTRGMDVRLL